MANDQMRLAARPLVKVLMQFTLAYGVLMTTIFFWGAKSVEPFINMWTAKTCAWALWLLGADGRARADVVVSSIYSIRIVTECTALYPLAIFAAAVLAFPSSWKYKLVALFGIPILATVNLVRIVSLCYIGHRFPSSMDTAHFVVWQSLMVFVTVLLWLFWAAGSKPTHEPSPA